MAKFSRVLLLMLALSTLLLSACGDKLDPSDPEGAFNLFKTAMLNGDRDTMWEHMAPSSREYFDAQLKRLHAMDEKIARYLPPTDHKLARTQAGSILTDSMTTGRQLFDKVVTPSGLPKDEKYLVGLTVEEIKVSEDEKTAAILTRGKQKVLLQYDEKNDRWDVMFVESFEPLKTAMKWMDANENALNQTIDDLLSEERRKRETILAELMGFED
ncbi:MAG: hypothetical protein R3E66_22110 [bacterium]